MNKNQTQEREINYVQWYETIIFNTMKLIIFFSFLAFCYYLWSRKWLDANEKMKYEFKLHYNHWKVIVSI